MLPVYKAQTFTKILEGGSTYPWLVLVNVNGSPIPYVVKLYTKAHIRDNFSVAKDVLTHVIAKQFKLSTPDAALIEFDEEFLSILPISLRASLDSKDDKIKFGTKLIDGAFQYIETLHKNYLQKFDIETVYAFDNLVKNTDRRKEKSNILLQGTNAYVIDHELTLLVNEKTIEQFHDNTWIYFSPNHIFFDALKDQNVDIKKKYFIKFHELLKTVNFDVLDSYYKQLLNNQHIDDYTYYGIKNYLCTIQKHSEKFINLLIAKLG